MKVTLGNILLFSVFALAIGLATNVYLHSRAQAPKTDITTATVFTQARPVAAFQLIDEQQRPFSDASLQDHWSFLFFGFTNCPDICPTTMSELAQVFTNNEALGSDTQVVLVTIDPTRDTPQQLAQYVHSFNENFKGVTGSDTQLQQLQQQFGITVNHREHMHHGDHAHMAQHAADDNAQPMHHHTEHTSEPMDHDADHDTQSMHHAAKDDGSPQALGNKRVDIDHSGSIILINPQGQYHALFSMPHDANTIAQDFAAIKANYQGNNT